MYKRQANTGATTPSPATAPNDSQNPLLYRFAGARIAGRTYDLLTALAVSAVLLLLDAPANLYNSGFWLSFGAVAGLGVVAPVLAGCIRRENRLAVSVMKTLVSSIAVQMTTFPIMLRIYGEISLAGFFLNLLVLPTVSVVLVSGIAAVAVGMASVSACLLYTSRCV